MAKLDRSPKGLRGVEQALREHDPEPDHAIHVCETALALFDKTKDLHGLGAPERRLLTAAALLHDTGWSTRPDAHHKGSRDIILAAPLTGFSDPEKQVVACAARYHRKAHPKPSHRVFGDLEPATQEVVRKLAALLRLADGLDRSHEGATASIRVAKTTQGLRFTVTQRRASPVDIWGAMRKRGLFEEVFGLGVDIVAGRVRGTRKA